MNRSEPLVLGIESSCDETGVGIVRGDTLLTNTVSSSMEEHVRFGGVIPEIASRAHLDAFVPTLQQALDEAGVTLDEVDALAVTSGPGLAGALMVGVCAAKALAVATGKPLYAINHLVAHVGVGLLDGGELPENLGALLVSGVDTVWSGEEIPAYGRAIVRKDYRGRGIVLERFAEMARFNYGSTVIVLLPPGVATLDPALGPETPVRLGQRLATRTDVPR